MLNIQRLICKDPKNYKRCRWHSTKLRFPDSGYQLLKSRLQTEVMKTGTAYRILHDEKGLLATIKRGHDGNLFVQEHYEGYIPPLTG